MSKDPRRFQQLLNEWHQNHNKDSIVSGDFPYHETNLEESFTESVDSAHQEGSLTDELDHAILMHKEAHFNGDFEVMLQYYEENHIGVHPDIEIDRIAYLKEAEEQLGKNLSTLVLDEIEMKRVQKARNSYAALKEIYELERVQSPIAFAIADMILSEEEEPINEIEAVVEFGERAVDGLISILKEDDSYDPLFPGYGYAPHLAAQCLGMIGSKHAIVPLFHMFSKELQFDEVVVLEALSDIGESARDFLLNVLRSRPLTSDNVHAAFALTNFCGDLSVATTCLNELFDPEVQSKPLLSTYLLSHFDSLKGTTHQVRVIELAQIPSLSDHLKGDLQHLLSEWSV